MTGTNTHAKGLLVWYIKEISQIYSYFSRFLFAKYRHLNYFIIFV